MIELLEHRDGETMMYDRRAPHCRKSTSRTYGGLAHHMKEENVIL
jgi:hypothetical protein